MNDEQRLAISKLRYPYSPSGTRVGSGDDDWIAQLAKISPILSGVSAFGSFINSVVAAQSTAKFQQQLISALQDIETALDGIKNDLDAIFQELKAIEQDIEGLALNDKFTAIETWGQEMAALSPSDKAGAQTLATAMMDASQGATNLLGCMNGLHDALVGNDIGTPVITLLDAPAFLRFRGRLLQGLQLLAFGTAFNTAEQYDYGVFLLQWAANFEQEMRLYFSSGKDTIPPDGLDPPYFMPAGDCVVIYQYAQPTLDNITLTIQGTKLLMPVYTGTLGSSIIQGATNPMIGFPGPQPAGAIVDFINDQSSTDQGSPLWAEWSANDDPNRWLLTILLAISGMSENVLAARGNLVCGARYNSAQTFLGAVNGQMAWVEATGAHATYLGSIHDGATADASLLTYDTSTKAITSVAFTGLKSLSPALWLVAWVSAGVISIASNSSTTADPVFLSIDASGNWEVVAEAANLTITVAAATQGHITNPFSMQPTSATLKTAGGSTKTVLFHQF